LAALRFADELLDTATSREIHRLPMYLKELAGLLQSFYQKKDNRVLGGDAQEAPALLALMGAVRTVLALGLGLLGVSAPEKM
jgi:arginyl-tRNA synthetase